MADLIDRDKVLAETWREPRYTDPLNVLTEIRERIRNIPSADPGLDEWCTDCKEYDGEKHCCPRFSRVIRETVDEVREQETGKWYFDKNTFLVRCSACGVGKWKGYCPTVEEAYSWMRFCPNCGARMEGEQNG